MNSTIMIFFFFFFIQHQQWCLAPFFFLLVCVIFNNSPSGRKQACAACKYKHRRCPPECPLAPYFPADEEKVFDNVHRLYGVRKMNKILSEIQDDDSKEDAIKSIKYESSCWEKYPHLGCCGVIMQQAIDSELLNLEIAFVRSLIAEVTSGVSTSESGPSWNPDPNSCPASSSRTLIPQGLVPSQPGDMDIDQSDVNGKGLSIQEQSQDAEAQYDPMNESGLANPEFNGSKKPVGDQG